jgi:uncharacterized protein
MLRTDLIPAIESYVKAEMASNDSSHDWNHIQRVRRMAQILALRENLTADQQYLAEISALLHDIKDWKYAGNDVDIGRWGAPLEVEQFLFKLELDDFTIQCVCYVIAHVGFSKEIETNGTKTQMVSNDLLSVLNVVQDADRLDAIGALGIIRCLTYGAVKGQPLYDPEVPPRVGLSAQEYKSGQTITMNHFEEKLFKLKDLMKTSSGRQVAEQRHQYMKGFVAQFQSEWDYQGD